jgi:AbrB family looped-hinge helix DNA binding protein
MWKGICKTMKLHGTTTIWPKGQIVIPKEVRDILKLSPWDSVAIITKDDKAVAIIKKENIQELLEYMKSEWIELEK